MDIKKKLEKQLANNSSKDAIIKHAVDLYKNKDAAIEKLALVYAEELSLANRPNLKDERIHIGLLSSMLSFKVHIQDGLIQVFLCNLGRGKSAVEKLIFSERYENI